MNHKSCLSYAVCAAVCALGVTALRVAASLLYTEAYTGVYTRDALLPKILTAASAVLITVFSVIGFIIQKKRFECFEKPKTRACVISTALTGFMCFAVSAVFLLDMMLKKTVTVASAAIVVSAFFSGFYYIADIFVGTKHKGIFALFALFPMLLNIVLLVELYFDTSILISCPNRYFNQLAYLAALLFLLSEMRNAIGSNAVIYIPSAAIAGSLLAISSLPNLISYFAAAYVVPNFVPASGETDRPIIYALQLAFAIYALVRLFSLTRTSKNNAENAEDPTEFVEND